MKLSQVLHLRPRPKVIAAVGDSLIAGMQDDCLDARAQSQGFVNQFARQAGLPFEVPYLRRSGGPIRFFKNDQVCMTRTLLDYSWLVGVAALPLTCLSVLGRPTSMLVNLACRLSGVSRQNALGPQNNFGVPGFKLQDVVDVKSGVDYLNNLLQHRTLSHLAPLLLPLVKSILGPGAQSQLDRAVASKPDLVVLCAGANDILQSVDGIMDDAHLTPMEDCHWRLANGTETIDVHPGLKTSMTTILDRLRHETNAEVLVCNLPDVTTIPSMKTLGEKVGPLPFSVKWRGKDITRALEDFVLPTAIKGEGKDGRTEFPTGSKVTLLNLLNSPRLLSSLYAGVQPEGGLFSEDQVADTDELALMKQRIAEFNTWLKDVADRDGRVHLVDIHRVLETVSKGYRLRGEGRATIVGNTFTGVQDQGFDGIFSYDGSHPSDVGQAVIANEVLLTVKRELGHDRRFREFKHLDLIDERAVYEQDPHRSRRPEIEVPAPEPSTMMVLGPAC